MAVTSGYIKGKGSSMVQSLMVTSANSTMVPYLKWTLLLVALFAVGEAQRTGRKKCDKAEFDNCSNRLLMLSDATFVFPTTVEAMTKRCKEVKTLEKCTKDYAKECLAGDTKNSISVLMYGISKTNKGYCTNNARKRAFTSFGDCLNKHKKKLAKYMEQYNRDLHGIKLYEDPKLRIPLGCCNYFKLKQMAINFITDKCSDAEVTEVESLIDGYAHDVLSLLCGDYTEDSDKCSRIIDKTPKWSKALTSKVFLLPLVEVLDSL